MHCRPTPPFLILVTCLLVACTSPLSPSEVLELGRAEARWASRPFSAYSSEIATSCGECPKVMQQVARGSVNDNPDIGAALVETHSALPPSPVTWCSTL